MSTVLIVVAIAVPLAGLGLYLALLVWAARADGLKQQALERWQREHRPRLVERRLRERTRRALPPPRSLAEREPTAGTEPAEREPAGPQRRS